MSYEHITFAAVKSLLADRLEDPGKVFWADAELGFALIEARRIWNTITLFDREVARVDTSENVAFYQLTSSLVNSNGELIRAQTIRDRSIVSEIEYHLMETQGLSSWAGTDQFTFNQILTAVQRRRDQFLADTACVVTTESDVVSGDSMDTVVLPDTVIGIRRAVFRDVNGRYYTLRSSDERMAAGEYWWTPGTPTSYSISAEQNQHVRVLPPPNISGTLSTVVVKTGAALNTTANGNLGTLLGVPDDLAWGVKYGALADLYRDFNSTDMVLADSCEQLYALSVQLAINMPVILHAYIDGRPVVPAAISYTDMSNGGWQGKTPGQPRILSTVAPDYIAVTPVPDGNPHTITLNVVKAANVPTVDGDWFDVGREHLDALIGMAQRICLLKVGGSEYSSAEPLSAKFFEQAQKLSYRRSAAAVALQVMSRNSTLDTDATPWMTVPRVVEDKEDEVKSERNARRRPFRKS